METDRSSALIRESRRPPNELVRAALAHVLKAGAAVSPLPATTSRSSGTRPQRHRETEETLVTDVHDANQTEHAHDDAPHMMDHFPTRAEVEAREAAAGEAFFDPHEVSLRLQRRLAR